MLITLHMPCPPHLTQACHPRRDPAEMTCSSKQQEQEQCHATAPQSRMRTLLTRTRHKHETIDLIKYHYYQAVSLYGQNDEYKLAHSIAGWDKIQSRAFHAKCAKDFLLRCNTLSGVCRRSVCNQMLYRKELSNPPAVCPDHPFSDAKCRAKCRTMSTIKPRSYVRYKRRR